MEHYNPFSLDGKSILVTGASSGIGKATSIELSKLGATLVITGRDRSRLGETLAQLSGEGHVLVPCDLSQAEERRQLVDRVPKLDGVAHIAGVGVTSLMSYATEEKFRYIYESNVFAPLMLQQNLLKAKKINRSASIVLMASVSACTAVLGNGIYGGSKAALVQSAKFLAMELAPKKIRVNSVSPGMVDTPMLVGSVFTEEQYEIDVQRYPLKRYGKPEEVAWTVAYLMSDASRWITGTDIVVDGGRCL